MQHVLCECQKHQVSDAADSSHGAMPADSSPAADTRHSLHSKARSAKCSMMTHTLLAVMFTCLTPASLSHAPCALVPSWVADHTAKLPKLVF